jgi:hypothetical protein
LRVYDESSRRRTQFCVQVNWSRERAFSGRQFNWILGNIPHVRGVYVVYLRDDVYKYRRGRRESPVLYFGSGWLDQRLSSHVDGQGSRALFDQLDEDRMAFRWAQIEDDDEHDWPVVVEGVFVYEFERLFGVLPPANQVRPPMRSMFEYSLVEQHPLDVLEDL